MMNNECRVRVYLPITCIDDALEEVEDGTYLRETLRPLSERWSPGP